MGGNSEIGVLKHNLSMNHRINEKYSDSCVEYNNNWGETSNTEAIKKDRRSDPLTGESMLQFRINF